MATAMVTNKSTARPLRPFGSVPDRAPNLEAAVVIQEPAAARRKGVDRLRAHPGVAGVAEVGVVVEHDVGARVELVREVVDRLPGGQPEGRRGFRVTWC